MGTVAYMSPEQAQGKRVDSRTDLFSLGVLLYEMTTGRRPFEGDNASAILAAILKEEPLDLSQLTPRFPEGVSRLVHRCLEKDPERRLPTDVELKKELEAASSAAGQRPPRRIAQAVAAAVLLAAIGLTYLFMILHGPSRSRSGDGQGRSCWIRVTSPSSPLPGTERPLRSAGVRPTRAKMPTCCR